LGRAAREIPVDPDVFRAKFVSSNFLAGQEIGTKVDNSSAGGRIQI
jgi:hypothetical protein